MAQSAHDVADTLSMDLTGKVPCWYRGSVSSLKYVLDGG